MGFRGRSCGPKGGRAALKEEPDEAEEGPMPLRKFIDTADAVGRALTVRTICSIIGEVQILEQIVPLFAVRTP